MQSREKIKKIFDRTSDSCGFWAGNPHLDTVPLYLQALHLRDMEEFFHHLQDDCRWIPADPAYRHPERLPMFDTLGGQPRTSLSQDGYFADCESLKEIEAFPWPDVQYLDFSPVLEQIRQHGDKAVFTGLWSHFFHMVCDFFGMENYFVKMYTHPEIVDAVTSHVVDFMVEANDRFFQAVGNEADIFFFGNDFGTQLDLLISPECFKKFVLPGMLKLIGVAKKYDKKVLLHSCGSIYKVLPLLVDAGVDAIHPIQALAANMDAKTLAREFKNDLAFVGGIDTQHLLVHGSPSEVRDAVRQLRDTLGPNLVVSPSHEALLPNVPVENVIAMAEAARE